MKLGTSILLSLISFVALRLTSIIAIPYAIVRAIHNNERSKISYYFSAIYFADAIGRDKKANVVLAPWLNRYFIHPNSPYKFGSDKHTISLIIGKNYYNGTLLINSNMWKSGMYWYNYVEAKDPGHFQSAIMDFETAGYFIPPNLI